MYRVMFLIVCCAVLLTAGSNVQGGEQCDGLLRTNCPNCKSSCTLKVECGTKDKYCFEIECEQICIPRVVFPWQKWLAKRNGKNKGTGNCDACTTGCDSCVSGCDGSGCDGSGCDGSGCDGSGCGGCGIGSGVCSSVNNGAKVRTVKKLKKKTYECPKCKYEWTPAGGCSDASCATGGCCDNGCDVAPLPSEYEPKARNGLYVPVPTPDVTAALPQRSVKSTKLSPVARRQLNDQ